MRFGGSRNMQAKVLFLGLLAVFVTSYFLIHLEWEIARLDKAREKLEVAMAQLQLGDVDQDHLRAPRSQTGVRDTFAQVDEDNLVMIYNRVPKTGSTSFAGVAYELCVRNKFHVLHLNVTKNSHVLSVPDQVRFVNNVTSWQTMKPALYHGHLAFLDFTKFGLIQKPLYINIIRNPLDRLISYYYFLRNGDDFRPHLKRRRMGNKMTFDECVEEGGSDCDPINLWLQIPFFCGHAAECWEPGSEWALTQAKYNLLNNYLLVGTTEELSNFVAVLEATVPRLFAGARYLFETGEKSHLRKTYNKLTPSSETVRKIHQSEIWRMENEFYEFASRQFQFVMKRTFDLNANGELEAKKQQFTYEKIRPR
ncbi:unnamed protein product [Owenia fusiformis]|uniref:Heparan sulfate 2-O-sulfotransferase 1 n=1 Tax=Owenia fusiformis TaxID=6347 RepID=A0A8J1UC47_OWEFU|nr:unnamed protein product [Owenia fusiformis]